MSNKKVLKNRYFDKGARALKNIRLVNQKVYCCPLCLKFFNFSAIESKNLTLEHAPIKSIGGKALALTCNKCNSNLGSSIDVAVSNREKAYNVPEIFEGKKRNCKEEIKLEVDNCVINATIDTYRKTGIDTKPLVMNNSPENLEAYKSYICSDAWTKKPHGKITFFKYNYNHRFSTIGDLKSAFIVCFALFGYTYILDKKLLCVRNQIKNYEENIIDGYWVTPKQEKREKVEKYSIGILHTPLPAIMVTLDRSVVMLPWLNSPDEFYQCLNYYHKKKSQVFYSGNLYKWPETLEMWLDFSK